MKTIFKYLATVVVISLISITFMAATHKTENNKKSENPPPCWIQPTVHLTGSCVFIDDNTRYIINLRIVNICSNPNTNLFDETKTVTTDITDINFCIQNQLCTIDQSDNCYQVIITVAKYNVITQQVVCSKQWTDTYNCYGLTYIFPANPVIITLN